MQLRKLLHLPLDSIVMKELKTEFPRQWNEYVVASYNDERNKFKENLIKQGKEEEANDSQFLHWLINPSIFSLEKILYKGMYYLKKARKMIFLKLETLESLVK